MDCSTPGFPGHHQLPELAQTHVLQVGDAIQPSHPLSSPSPPAFNLSQNQDLFQWVSSSHQVAKVLQLQQYCIGTWNAKSMNQGKLEVVKQETARVNVDILGISKLKWTGMGEFNSDDHYIYYCGQESLRRNAVAIIVNKSVWNAPKYLSTASKSTERALFVSKENQSISQ